MQKVSPTSLPSTAEMTTLSAPQLIELVQSLVGTVQSLQHQLEWFQRQMFGTKSERMRVLEGASQLALDGLPAATDSAAPPKQRTILAHQRRVAKRDAVGDSESVPFFDGARADGDHRAAQPGR
jgi:transposase